MSFLNKLGEKATEVYNTTADKTSKITKEMKLKSTISEKKSRINKIYQEIGEGIFNKYTNKEEINISEQFSEQLYEIDLCNKEIENAQAEIRVIKDLKLCNSCNKELNITARFCPFCGKQQDMDEKVTHKNENQDKEVNKNTQSDEGMFEARAAENSKRQPNNILTDKTILDIEEPNIIIEEIGEKDVEE